MEETIVENIVEKHLFIYLNLVVSKQPTLEFISLHQCNKAVGSEVFRTIFYSEIVTQHEISDYSWRTMMCGKRCHVAVLSEGGWKRLHTAIMPMLPHLQLQGGPEAHTSTPLKK